MKVTAVIAEYNPLHYGHVRHLEAARKASGADYIVAVMSGDYVQRGCPAIISKYERTRSVLLSGADLVAELPVQYSTGSLEYFAMGAVSLIQNLGIVSCISFGSECGDIDSLRKASEYIDLRSETVSLHPALSPSGQSVHAEDKSLSEESVACHPGSIVRARLKQGNSYSAALNSAQDIPEHIRHILSTPNNLLAAAYIRAAERLSFDCEFHTLKRSGSGYHDVSSGALSSSALREEILRQELIPGEVFSLHNSSDPGDGSEQDVDQVKAVPPFSGIYERMPEDVYKSLCEHLGKYPPLSEDDFSHLLFYKLLAYTDDPEALTIFHDVSAPLARKIIREYRHAGSYSGLCMKLKSRDLNFSRISRALMHILLDIKAEDMRKYISGGFNYYIRPLGFRRSSTALMHELKLRTCLPVISKTADAERILNNYYAEDSSSDMKKQAAEHIREYALEIICHDKDPDALSHAVSMFRTNILASELYNKTACIKCRQPFRSEYEHSITVI